MSLLQHAYLLHMTVFLNNFDPDLLEFRSLAELHIKALRFVETM